MIRINLLPVRAAQKKERLRGQIIILVLSLLLVGIACGAAYLHIGMKIDAANAEIATKNQQISALRKQIGEVGRFKKLQEELRGKLEILETLKKARSGPARYLDELNRIIPDKLWLTEFSESAGNIKVKGVALSEQTVAEFMRSLGMSRYFSNVNLVQTAQSTQQGLKLQSFQLDFKLNYEPKDKS